MTATLRVPRSRGALSGGLLVLLGLWGALMPLVGPYFHFGFAPDTAWHTTSGRIWLQIVPGAAVFLGGLITLGSGNRAFASFGGWLAALGGAWFAVGVPLSGLWADSSALRLGQPLGNTTRQVSEWLTLFYGLGVVAEFLAAVAIGRLAVIAVRDAALAEQAARNDTGLDDADATTAERRSPWAEQAPATSPQPLTSRTSDTRVAGAHAAEETRAERHPNANT